MCVIFFRISDKDEDPDDDGGSDHGSDSDNEDEKYNDTKDLLEERFFILQDLPHYVGNDNFSKVDKHTVLLITEDDDEVPVCDSAKVTPTGSVLYKVTIRDQKWVITVKETPKEGDIFEEGQVRLNDEEFVSASDSNDESDSDSDEGSKKELSYDQLQKKADEYTAAALEAKRREDAEEIVEQTTEKVSEFMKLFLMTKKEYDKEKGKNVRDSAYEELGVASFQQGIVRNASSLISRMISQAVLDREALSVLNERDLEKIGITPATIKQIMTKLLAITNSDICDDVLRAILKRKPASASASASKRKRNQQEDLSGALIYNKQEETLHVVKNGKYKNDTQKGKVQVGKNQHVSMSDLGEKITVIPTTEAKKLDWIYVKPDGQDGYVQTDKPYYFRGCAPVVEPPSPQEIVRVASLGASRSRKPTTPTTDSQYGNQDDDDEDDGSDDDADDDNDEDYNESTSSKRKKQPSSSSSSSRRNGKKAKRSGQARVRINYSQ